MLVPDAAGVDQLGEDSVKHRSTVAVVSIATLLMTGCGSSQDDEPVAKWGKPRADGTYQITYLVKGFGTAQNVTYIDADGGQVEKDDVPLPWGTTVSERTPLTSSSSAGVNAISGGELSCQIWVNGKEFAAQEGQDGAASCSSFPYS